MWVQPKEMVIGKTATPMACPALIGNPSAHCESGTYWEEAVLHVALSGVTVFGFWGTPAAGATNYTDIRLSRILTELDGIVGAADRLPFNVTIIDWMPMRSLVVSSMSLNQGATITHRVVCLDQGSTLSAVEQAGTVRVECGGVDARIFSQSKLVNLTSTVSPMGRWVLQTIAVKTDDADESESPLDVAPGGALLLAGGSVVVSSTFSRGFVCTCSRSTSQPSASHYSTKLSPTGFTAGSTAGNDYRKPNTHTRG